ncbi:MAG: hypothetical protein RBS36_08545 [Thiomicrospira sp.]|jgi:hypothetical protein|nr:hypothetical protein [Thiomicrospira sp.]
MKKLTALTLSAALLGASFNLAAQSTVPEETNGVCKNSYSLISYELRPRSVPKFIMALEGELALNNEQKKALKAITTRVPNEVLPQRDVIKQKEIALLKAFIEEGKTAQQLQAELDEIMQMKRQLAEDEIAVFNEIKALLSDAQYQTAIKNAGWQY